MANSVIGALRVNLGLNSASFRSGLEQSKKSVLSFKQKAVIAFGALAAAAGAAFAKIKSHAEAADELIKASRAVGVNVEELSRLKHGAELSGASFNDLQKSIIIFSKNIGQALMGASNDATKGLALLKVPLKDVNGYARKTEDILKDVADRFKSMPDGIEKTAIAANVLGRSGPKLISFLNSGRAGIEALGNEAEKLGLVINERTGVASELFNDSLARLSKSLTGMWNQVLNNVIPSLAAFTSKLAQSAMEGGNFDKAVKGISGAFNVLLRGLIFVYSHLKDLYDLFRIWVGARIVTYIVSLGGAFLTMARTVRTAGISLALVTSITRAKIIAIVLLTAAIAKLTGTYDDLVGWIERFSKTVLAALPEGVRKGIESFGKSLADLTNDIAGVDAAAAKSFETYLAAGDKARLSFEGVAKSAKKVKPALTEAEKEAQAFADKVGQGFNSVGTSIRGLIEGTNTWIDVLKTALGHVANFFIQQGITNAFGSDSPLSKGLSGLFEGLFKFKDGGQFEVGGFGGTDSQLVQFMATPGENVRITKQGEDMGPVAIGDVIVNNYPAPGTESEVTQRRGSGGKRIIDIVSKATAKTYGLRKPVTPT